MAGGVATLFQQLGDIISNFKIDLRLSVKKFKLERPDGCLIPLPQADFSLEATESTAATMKSIGSAISNFGNDLQANIEATQITTEDFKIKNNRQRQFEWLQKDKRRKF